MSLSTPMVVIGAVGTLLVVSMVSMSSGPVAINTHVGVDMGSFDSVLRTAVSEMRDMRGQVAQLQDRLYRLHGRSSRDAPAAAPALARLAPVAEAAIDVQTSTSSAPSSFLDAVALDDGRPTSNLSVSVLANLTSTQPDCGMLLFRHIEKTGGTTFRMHMVALHECGWHVWGYKGAIRLCNKAKAEWAMLRDPTKRPARADGVQLLPRLTVESHAESLDYIKMLDAWVPMVQAWHGTCGMWLISIVREPLQRQHIKNFTQYFNEQSTLLNRRSANTQFLQRHILLPRLLGMEQRAQSQESIRTYALKELDKFDAIGVFEHYTASMLLIARATGLPLSKYSAPTLAKNRNIKPHRSKVKQIWEEELASASQQAYFKKHLELDYWFYDEVKRRFDAQVKAAGPTFDAQLRELLVADTSQLDSGMERICSSGCDSGLDKEQSTNRFVWKNQQCRAPADRELTSCGPNPHLNPDFNFGLCG
ncbi:hypothetical protein T492DRAFT_928172 [Pavlovales sp. CCMP2436]|nr:hypothetical protein T492DRAFT_928172 [Pavlovales sp. CCMP2436]